MAQYYAVLKKAISALQPSSSDARRGIYEKARSALVNQLKAIQPPLSTSEISRQRLELEEAIRKVEREALAVVPIQVVPPPPVSYEEDELPVRDPEPEIEDVEPVESAPYAREDHDHFAGEPRPYEPAIVEDEIDDAPIVTPPPRPEQQPAAALRQAFGFDDKRAAAERTAPPPAREPRSTPIGREARREQEPQATGWRPLTPAAPVEPEPEVEEEILDAEAAAPVREERRRRAVVEEPGDAEAPTHHRRSRMPAIILGTILVLAVGLIGYLWQQGLLTDATAAVSSLFSRGDNAPAGEATTLDPTKAADRVGAEPTLAPPSNVRVIDTTAQGGTVPAPPQPPASANPPAGANPPTTIGDLAALAPPVTPGAQAPVAVPVQQRALLIEQALTGTEPVVTPGTVTWTYDASAPDGATLVADVAIPTTTVRVQIRIRENNDAGMPASHLIELSAPSAAGLPGGGLDDVLVPVMKATFEEVGEQLAGSRSVAVTPTVFWIALLDDAPSRAKNIRLLGDQKFMDIPLIYTGGRRAFLTLELGAAGEQLVDQAILAWAAP